MDFDVEYQLKDYSEDHEFSMEELKTILIEYSGGSTNLGEYIESESEALNISPNDILTKPQVIHLAKHTVLVQWKKEEDDKTL